MAQTRTDEGADEACHEEVIDTFGIEPLATIDPLHDLDADEEANDEHQRIPAQREGAPLEDDRMGCPGDFS